MKKLFVTFFTVALSTLLSGCFFQWDNAVVDIDDNGNVVINVGNGPQITILSPTSGGVYVTTDAAITISGVAQGNAAIAKISYTTSGGASGSAVAQNNWSINDVPLVNGDNKITITVVDIDNNASEKTFIVTRNQYLNFGDVPKADKNIIYAGEPTSLWITSSILPNDNLIEESVKLIEVDENGTVLSDITQMYDDGNLDNGDEIIGDNVFSTKHSFNFATPGKKYLRVSAKTNENGKEVEGFSAIFTIMVLDKEKLDSKINDYFEVQKNVENKLKELYESSLPDEQLISQMLAYVKGLSLVKEASVSNGIITMIHQSGLKSHIMIDSDKDNGLIKGGTTGDRYKKPRIPLNLQTRGTWEQFGWQPKNITRATTTDPQNIIMNKKVLIWAPWEDEFSIDMETSLLPIFENSPIKLEVATPLSDEECTLASLKNITEYGIVVFDTHGGGGRLLLTREPASANPSQDFKEMIDQQAIESITRKKGSFYLATDVFIRTQLNGDFQNSIIFNGSCESTKTELLAEAFLAKKAKTYLGFSESVSTSFCKNKADEFFTALTGDDLKKTGEAYVLDSYYDSSAKHDVVYEIRGSEEMYFYLGLINGDFEFGKLDGWVHNGDGRVISALVTQKPTQGKYMGIVSTGLGFTKDYGSIYQSFRVNKEKKLTIKWNFLSEEFLEYVGSQYQDFLKVTIIDGNNKTVLCNTAIDSFYNKYDLISVSPNIVFDQGGVYMTGWKTSTFDISAFAGKTVTLMIECGDVGDSLYDSATLLDEISID